MDESLRKWCSRARENDGGGQTKIYTAAESPVDSHVRWVRAPESFSANFPRAYLKVQVENTARIISSHRRDAATTSSNPTATDFISSSVHLSKFRFERVRLQFRRARGPKFHMASFASIRAYILFGIPTYTHFHLVSPVTRHSFSSENNK